MAVLIIVGVVVVNKYNYSHSLFLSTMLDIILGIALIFAVFHMRKTIKSTKFAIPNDKLVVIHLTNFNVWALIYGA